MDTRAALTDAETQGILPLTSTCNLTCVFCSNRANPPEVLTHTIPHRTREDLERALERMGHLDQVTIGESASRVSEGEPLTHPRFLEILALVRRALPAAVIKVTTNGTLLDPRTAETLAELMPVEVVVSVNTLSSVAFREIHGASGSGARAPAALAAAGVPFHAGVVALPAITGPDDLSETARRLEGWGCLSCRVFTPGYTRLTPPEITRLMPDHQRVAALVERARLRTDLPLTLEPPLVEDLSARVVGVMRDTPASRAGLRAGDVITQVDGVPPFSRVDAFLQALRGLRKAGRCRLRVLGRAEEVVLTGPPGDRRARPGFILDRDIDPGDVALIGRASKLSPGGGVLVLSSALGAGPLRLGLGAGAAGFKEDRRGGPVEVYGVPSKTFGGSIGCAGLLTVTDMETALIELGRRGRVKPGSVVVLPPVAFDFSGRDLTGRRPGELKAVLPRDVVLVAAGEKTA